MGELERRLVARSTDSDAVIAERMRRAAGEIEHWAEYDYVLVNDDMDRCLGEVRTIVAAERLRRSRQLGLTDFVQRADRLSAAKQFEKPRTGQEIRFLAPVKRLLRLVVRAPALALPASSTLTASQAFSGAHAPSSTASAAISDPPAVTIGDRPASRKASSAATSCSSRSTVAGGCSTWVIPVVTAKSTSKRRRAQPSSASHSLRLPIDQCLGPLGAVASEVGLGIFGEVGGERRAIGRDPVDRGVGEAGQRHRPRVDVALDPVPFRGNRLGQRHGRHLQGTRARRPHRPAVELDPPPLGRLDDRGHLPEALHFVLPSSCPSAS